MILPASIHHWPPDARAEYEERASICEFLGNLPLSEAEALAEHLVRKEWAQKEQKTA